MSTSAATPTVQRPKPMELTAVELLHPTADRVLVLPAPEIGKIGSVHLADQAKEKPVRGIVLAVGPGKPCDSCGEIHPSRRQVQVGHTVLYGKYAGSEIKVGNEILLIMREEEIIGVVRNPDPPQQDSRQQDLPLQ